VCTNAKQGLCTGTDAPADILAAAGIFVPTGQEASMGMGDRRTRRGKIYNGSYGKKRPGRLKKQTEGAATHATAPTRAGRGR
jgi:ribosomal small subunit protein bTHX